MNAEERLLGRFRSEFEAKGLANVKFFVRPDRMSVADLIGEINQFEDTVSAGDVVPVDIIDKDIENRTVEKKRFDAPFE